MAERVMEMSSGRFEMGGCVKAMVEVGVANQNGLRIILPRKKRVTQMERKWERPEK